MFEVDWADYESERVGERRARKEIERAIKKDNASNDQGTVSTRSSCPSDRTHMSFFGSIGRKKAIASPPKAKKQEAVIPRSTKADAKVESSSINPQTVTESRGISMDTHSTGPELKSSDVPLSSSIPHPIAKRAPRPESMLSKMTQLTIPTQGEGSVAETAFATTKLVHVLEEGAPLSAKALNTIPGHGWLRFASPSQTGDGPRIAASPRTPRTPRAPPSFQCPTSPNDKSASEFIDDWFTALHGPTHQLPRPGLNGTIHRGNVLLPQNLHRLLPSTPTRRSVKRDFSMTPKASPTRFLAHDPDDWKPVAEWNCTHSTGSHVLSSTNNGAHPHENERIPGKMAVDMEAMPIREGATKEGNNLPPSNKLSCVPAGQVAQNRHRLVHQESGALGQCNSPEATSV
ncbi:hypothetical protein C8A03DRAFT_12610 [Achaetomium macrosporum]|uniref:Uncharacterized protein n=1 Tax=Achaetomium macrosporum TaxID=79813 RepID=A0AAN7CG22_9PEZI|nr:hypothetical protein C8A03DRAFT_12610 [Achaetomium macrosporum]